MLIITYLPLLLFSAALATPITSISITPAPTPAGSTTLIPTATASASAANSNVVAPSPTLAPRCGDGDCSFGGSAQTLSASVVTSTIMSTTSVPCYVTTYITNSQTVTQTIYSTETITSTVTSEGTVYIIQYSPTPVLMSSVYESVLELTQTWTSYWETVSGSAWESTSTAAGGVQSGGGGGGCDACEQGGSQTTAQSGGSGSSGGGGSAAVSGGGAWTHAAAADNAGISTIGTNGSPVAGNPNINTGNQIGGQPAALQGQGQGQVAGGDGWTSSGGSSNNVAMAGAGGGGGMVNWSASSPTNDPRRIETILMVVLAISVVLFWEVGHYMWGWDFWRWGF